ncbi:ATP-binding protein [Streptomyces sp. ISL-11]|uniref:ATP-binding protein n=1 Tax=Streptomyces sp. ISL-11 TaxID=2819174 RepID=UPI001BE72661|nr:ATP-binding protein [Streptomyces sp. ISL-11]MBT2382530.1 ATP-binding protein [Streptomyces sp. ISL-11]
MTAISCATVAPPRPETYRLVAPTAPTTARLARDFVTAALAAANRRVLIEEARICVSDAVANVVRQARVPELTVELTVLPGSVTVAVRDDDPTRPPWPRRAGAGEGDGRGLSLVRRIAHASGVTWVWDGLDLVGKQIWFELREGGTAPFPAADSGRGAAGLPGTVAIVDLLQSGVGRHA